MAARLVARIEVSASPTIAEEATARVLLENEGDEPALVSLAALSSPSLALEIRDEHDQPVLLPPPPLPSGEQQVVELPHGGRREAEFRGFVPSWTPAGSYRVRFRYVPGGALETLYSDWAPFELVSR